MRFDKRTHNQTREETEHSFPQYLRWSSFPILLPLRLPSEFVDPAATSPNPAAASPNPPHPCASPSAAAPSLPHPLRAAQVGAGEPQRRSVQGHVDAAVTIGAEAGRPVQARYEAAGQVVLYEAAVLYEVAIITTGLVAGRPVRAEAGRPVRAPGVSFLSTESTRHGLSLLV